MQKRCCYVLYFMSTFFWSDLIFTCPGSCPTDLPRDAMSLQSLSYDGSGCPRDTVTTEISPDLQVATVIFSDFIVEKDGRYEKGQRQKFCTITVSILTSPAFLKAGFTLHTEGSFDLEQGAQADQATSYFEASNLQKTVLTSWSKTGYQSDDYIQTSNGTISGSGVSLCNKYNQTFTMHCNLRVRPDGGLRNNASGFISLNQLEFKLPDYSDYHWHEYSTSGGFISSPSITPLILASITGLYFYIYSS